MNDKQVLEVEKHLKSYIKVIPLIFVSFLYLISSEAKWEDRIGDMSYCSPSSYYQYPIIPFMPINSQQKVDSELYMFIEQYIHDVYNETIVDYQKPSKLQRRSYTYLKAPLQRAIMHSKGYSLEVNKKLLVDSSDRYRDLKDKNVGWIFNIQALESIEPHAGVIRVSVLGEYQKTTDRMYSDLDHEFWGYRRIYLTIVRNEKNNHSNKNLSNETGYYVTFQEMTKIPALAKDKLYNTLYNTKKHLE